jgi:outer membrane protein
MKKVLFTAVAVLGFTFANAQDETSSTGGFSQGDVFVSGSFGFGSDKAYDMDSGDLVTNSGYSFSPKVGYFLSENIAIGGKLGFGSSKAEIEGVSGEFKVNELTVGAFGRYYFTPSNQFSLFGDLGVDYMSTNYDSMDLKRSGVAAGLGLGMNYFVSSNFSIEAGLGLLNYSSMKFDFDGAENESSFGLGADLTSISLGVNYKF